MAWSYNRLWCTLTSRRAYNTLAHACWRWRWGHSEYSHDKCSNDKPRPSWPTAFKSAIYSRYACKTSCLQDIMLDSGDPYCQPRDWISTQQIMLICLIKDNEIIIHVKSTFSHHWLPQTCRSSVTPLVLGIIFTMHRNLTKTFTPSSGKSSSHQ